MLFLIIAILLFAIILWMKIEFKVEYVRGKDYSETVLSFSILHNLIKFNIPLSNMGHQKDKSKQKPVKEKKEKAPMGFFEIKEKIKSIKESYREYKFIFNRVRNYLKPRMICKKLLFHLEFGFGDAALTGIASGLLWGLIYNGVSVIDRSLVLKEQDIKIVPDFNHTKLNIRLYSIFAIRTVHIINIFFILLFSILKMIITQKGIRANKSRRAAFVQQSE